MSDQKSLNGVLNINKPIRPTSHDIVAHLRRLLTTNHLLQTKVGHAGTLDPFANGVLVVALGSATRLLEYTRSWDKKYQAEFTLGATSDTDDLTGHLTFTRRSFSEGGPDPYPNQQDIKKILRHFIGLQLQTPPAYSAVKRDGQKLYNLARRGQLNLARRQAQQSQREVNIKSLSLRAYDYPLLQLDITCSGGTYIRSLARDLGHALKTGAYVSKLTRTAVGPMELTDAINFENLNFAKLMRHRLSPNILIQDLPFLILPQASVAKLIMGQGVGEERAVPAEQPIALFDEQENLIGIGQYDSVKQVLSPCKILAN